MKIHITKALVAAVLITLSAHTQASLVKYIAPVAGSSSSLSGTFTYDNVLNIFSNVNLTYGLANGNIQTISALTSNGANSASTLSRTFIGARPIQLQNTEFTLSLGAPAGLNLLSLVTWSGITDILTFDTQRRIFGFQESGVTTFSVTQLLASGSPSRVPLPSSIALFASGLVGFAGYRRRQKQI